MKKFIATVVICVVPFFAQAKSNPAWCQAREYKIKTQNLSEMKTAFDQVPRTRLIQGLWFGLLEKKPKADLIPRLQYLAYTEQKSQLSGYYQIIASALGVDQLSEAIDVWPKTPQLKPVKTSMKELCSLYAGAGGEDFQ